MSNRAAGKRFENKIQKYLESLGFAVDKARAALHFTGPGKFFSSSCDFFGAADLIAIHPEKPYTLFVQATLGDPGPRKKKMESVAWNLAHHKVQVWEREASIRGGFRVQQLGIEKRWSEYFFRGVNGEAPVWVL